jgi:hypothetical protein
MVLDVAKEVRGVEPVVMPRSAMRMKLLRLWSRNGGEITSYMNTTSKLVVFISDKI